MTTAADHAWLAWGHRVKQGWFVQRGKQYCATKEGERELLQRFGITI